MRERVSYGCRGSRRWYAIALVSFAYGCISEVDSTSPADVCPVNREMSVQDLSQQESILPALMEVKSRATAVALGDWHGTPAIVLLSSGGWWDESAPREGAIEAVGTDGSLAPGMSGIWVRAVKAVSKWSSLIVVGDVDGDAINDLCASGIVEAGSESEACHQARVRLISGASGATIACVEPMESLECLGASAAVVQGTRGVDRIVALGDPTFIGNTQRGGVVSAVKLGQSHSISEYWRAPGPDDCSFFGEVIIAIGDVDGDGQADFATGGAGKYEGESRGRLWALSSRNGSIMYEINPGEMVAGFASAMLRVSDVDGDGCDDIIVGAPGWKSSRPSDLVSGCVELRSGRTGKLVWAIGGHKKGDGFGLDIAHVEDVTGDGAREVVVLERSFVTGESGGRLTLVDVRRGVKLGSTECCESGLSPASVVELGDINGDHVGDIAMHLASDPYVDPEWQNIIRVVDGGSLSEQMVDKR